MNRVDYALSLMAEASAHGIAILYSRRDIGLSTCRPGWVEAPEEFFAELDAYANEIWAILHHYRSTGTAS